ncbi:hypothetical protein Aperf_G00000019837 [Anoplocephala perfoliata]
MSDDSSDECFASADEGSDSDIDLMVSSLKQPIDRDSVKNPQFSKPHMRMNEYWDSWEHESSPSIDKSIESPCIDRQEDKTTPVGSNFERVSFTGPQINNGAGNLAYAAQTLVHLEEVPKGQVADTGPVSLTERDSHYVGNESHVSQTNPTTEGNLISSDLPDVMGVQFEEKQAEEETIEVSERKTSRKDADNPCVSPKESPNMLTEDTIGWNDADDQWEEVTPQQNEGGLRGNAPSVFKPNQFAELDRITREFDPLEQMSSVKNDVSQSTPKKVDEGPKNLRTLFVPVEKTLHSRALSRESNFKKSEATSEGVDMWNDEEYPWAELTPLQTRSSPKEFGKKTGSSKMGVSPGPLESARVLKEGDIGSEILITTSDPMSMKEADPWDVENDPWLMSQAGSSKARTSPGSVSAEQVPSGLSDADNVWNLEGDLRAESQSKKQKNLKFVVRENKCPSVKVEESNIWDLEDDPWTNSGMTFSESHNPKAGDIAEGANMRNLHEKLSLISAPSNPSQELSSAATALVKSVGGGLASFMGGLMPSFENPSTPEDSSHSEVVSKPHGDVSESSDGGWGVWNLGSIAKTLTSTVETTGMQLIHGGVDVLEQIGRKTFAVLKENDPGLVYTKRFLRPVDASRSKLSQILREARDQESPRLAVDPGSSQSEARRGDLASQLELRLALVHMEALELLSSRASARLTTKLTDLEASHETLDADVNSLTSEGGVLERIWRTLQLKDQDVDSDNRVDTSASTTLSDAVKVLDQIVPGNVLVKTCDKVQKTSKELEGDLPMKEIFYRSIEALAESTSAVLAYLHKLAECLLLVGQHRDRFNSGFLDITEKVAGIITAAKGQNEALCSTYVEHLKHAAVSCDEKDATKTDKDEGSLTATRRLVASLFLETGMANGYLDDAAANHLVPVLQVACLDAFLPEGPPSPTKLKQR